MALSYTEGELVALPAIPFAEQIVLPADRTALVVVDMQNDFVTPGGSLVVPDAAATVPAIAGLLARARTAGLRVAFTQDTHMEGDREWSIWPAHTRAGSWGWQIIDALAPQEGELVVQKARYDGFYGSALDHYLTRQWGVEHLVIVGTIASICVLHTAASAGLRWFHVVVPADGISALTPFDQALTLRQVSWLYAGHVVRAMEAIAFA
jgi:nicotinamidase-related amidase